MRVTWWVLFLTGLVAPVCGGAEAVTLRVASLMVRPVKWDKDANRARLDSAIREAKEQGAELVVTPEGALEGYVVNEVIRATGEQRRELTVRFGALAEPCDGAYIRHFRDLCKELGVHLVLGFLEADAGQTYNTAILIRPDGTVAGKYRKTHFAQGYSHGDEKGDNPPGYLRGTEYPVFEVCGQRMGIMICYDRRKPIVAQRLVANGAEFIINPAFGMMGDCNAEFLTARSEETHVPILFVHPDQTVYCDAQANIQLDLRPEGDDPRLAIVPVELHDRLGELVTIPAGRFLMGTDGDEAFAGPEEHPQHAVYLPTYQIGKYEVTRGQHRRFIEAGGYDDPNYWSAEGWRWKESDFIVYAGMHGNFQTVIRPNKEEKRNQPEHWAAEQEWIGHGYRHPVFIQTDAHPVVGVTYYEAEAYCKWAGGRLPTEAEWEKAARWDEENQHANIWPWGDVWDPEKCNNPEDHNPAGGGYRTNQSAPVGSYPDGASPYGCMDMVGNAYEWVADVAKSYPGSSEPFAHEGYHFVRGGCWDDGPLNVRCAYRGWYLPPSSSGVGPGDSDYIGFRVAR